jgi:tRNA(adenine34) deaminase
MARKSDEHYMNAALKEAHLAAAIDEVPVGAIIVDEEGKIVARAHNLREKNHSPTAHAELLAIEKAARTLGRWRLSDCTLYVTLEPCPMCAGAVVNSRLKRIVYATDDPKAGAVTSLYKILTDERLNHQPEVEFGLLAEESAELLKEFFRKKRLKN